jgi:DNA polymerase/3'-5' exonuclease PolX
MKKKFRKTIPFTTASKKNLSICLTKKVKDLYNENYKTLKKLQKTVKDGKTSHVHGLADLIS